LLGKVHVLLNRINHLFYATGRVCFMLTAHTVCCLGFVMCILQILSAVK